TPGSPPCRPPPDRPADGPVRCGKRCRPRGRGYAARAAARHGDSGQRYALIPSCSAAPSRRASSWVSGHHVGRVPDKSQVGVI
ncbi:hypothetical protein ABTB07_22910, partial [Acinetobacter baumannii]